MFGQIFRRNARRRAVGEIYGRIVTASRRPVFYERYGVPDSFDGRFELLVMHMHLVLRRLKDGGREEAEFAQDLFDYMFADLDVALREQGVGDLGVGKKIKRMAEAFFGRVSAYDAGLAAADDAALVDALDRNLYGTLDETDPRLVGAMAGYVRWVAGQLGATPPDALMREVSFPDPLLETME